ncbi:MAG: AAA family ATPase [Candidatus Thermoplasmatota archaeon]|jgi:2-phosphoglycerate kinase|nr:AAA family ATPase [Candidatus Thermoplasmatota archaeon]
MNTIYVISGPSAVGKSTISKLVANSLPKSALISGDHVHHMIIGGHLAPWKDVSQDNLTWKNIAELTKNFLDSGFDVVIDAVVFPSKVRYLKDAIGKRDVITKYVILLADKSSLLQRDNERTESMEERCLVLLEEFNALNPKPRNYLDTTSKSPEEIAGEILRNDQNFLTD